MEGQNFYAAPKRFTPNNLGAFRSRLFDVNPKQISGSQFVYHACLLESPQSMMDDNDILDFLLIATSSLVLTLEAVEFIEQEESTALKEHIKEQRRLCRSLPAEKTRPTWTGFCHRISDIHFRRQFRMSRNTFSNLCSLLSSVVGNDRFRPESMVISSRNTASLLHRGGLIPGEIKVAISIRILAGGSYLDLVPLFDVSSAKIYVILEEFIDWVLRTFQFPLVDYLHDENWNALSAIAEPFSYGSNGILSGVIGAIDGLAVRIRSPRLSEVSDPGNYYCRKGFFALNVQAICDKSKRFLWCYTSNKGSTHDSVAFSNSRLHSLLAVKALCLREKGFYLVGDSAYNLTEFLLVPYSSDDVRNDDSNIYDAFNFFLSSCRIYIECAFGELVMRWGILWRTLRFDLVKCQQIVQVCMLLHNHIKNDNRNENQDDINGIDQDWRPTAQLATNGERAFPLVTDNNEENISGRRSVSQECSRRRGDQIRRSLAVLLHVHGMDRPVHSGMRYNQYGHVVFDG